MATIKKKIVLVGGGAAGKTSAALTFVCGRFPTVLLSTTLVGDHYVADVVVDGVSVELDLWDTAGFGTDGDRYRSLSYPDTDAVIMFYSIDDPQCHHLDDVCDDVGNTTANTARACALRVLHSTSQHRNFLPTFVLNLIHSATSTGNNGS